MLSRFSRLVAASSPRGTHPTTASRRPLFILNGRLSSIAGGAAATPPTRDDYAALSTGFSQPRAGLSSAAASAGVSHRTAFPPVAGLEKQQSPAELLKTPPMEEEDPGPKIREMRVQFRPVVEQGSRGARRLRKGAMRKRAYLIVNASSREMVAFLCNTTVLLCTSTHPWCTVFLE